MGQVPYQLTYSVTGKQGNKLAISKGCQYSQLQSLRILKIKMPLRCNMMIFAAFHLYIQANVNCRPEAETSHRVNHASRVWSLTCRLHGCKSTNRKKDAASRGSPAQPAIEACQSNERAASNPIGAAYLRQRC